MPNHSVNPKSSTDHKIDYRFKVLYAIGMIMIVAGHCNGGGINILADWFPYYGQSFSRFLYNKFILWATAHENLPRRAF
ncbi:hypothetical protein IJV57_01430 [Candidatus Saccharibacteria bacterium]|nr:hypothetical protein [Candidatus Saccharibacteria bacterium]